MSVFCLIPGAWHGSWCWEHLTRELEWRGQEVITPDLPYDDPSMDLARCADVLGPHPDAVVVGHSFGGLVLPLIEARVHVYLCALVRIPATSSGRGLHGGARSRVRRHRARRARTNLLAEPRPRSGSALPRTRPQVGRVGVSTAQATGPDRSP